MRSPNRGNSLNNSMDNMRNIVFDMGIYAIIKFIREFQICDFIFHTPHYMQYGRLLLLDGLQVQPKLQKWLLPYS